MRLPQKSNILDRIDLQLTPYLVDPISLIGNNKVQWIGVIAPTQSGKTVFLQASVADMIDQDPGPGLYVLPDEKSGKKHLEEKVVAIIESTPDLAAHLTVNKHDVSQGHIRLDHMTIYPGWAGSLATLSSFPMKRVWLDEVRLMPLTIGNESNAIKLSNDRLTTFLDYGIGQGYMVSSPSIEGDLLFQQVSIPGTLYVGWQVKCLRCGGYQELDFFENVKFTNIDDTRCICKYCGFIFDDIDKKKSWNNTGKFVKLEFGDGKWAFVEGSFNYSDYSRVFFHWDSLVSPFRSFRAIVKEYLETKDRIHDYKNFWQCWLARFWIEDKSKASVVALRERQKPYLKGYLPVWAKVLTAGIDSQDNGFYVVVRAWGAHNQTALIDAFFIPCALEIASAKDAKDLFQRDLFDRVYQNNSGTEKWKVALAAIDTGGHRTRQLYEATATFKQMLWIKGAHRAQKLTIEYSKEYNLYNVKTDEYADESDTRALSDTYILPQNIQEDYLTQFCNYRKTEKQNKLNGSIEVIWKKIGQCDYRLADMHAYICLDIPTDIGTLRNELEKPGFLFNPLKVEQELQTAYQQQETKKKMLLEQPAEAGYHINSFDWQ